MFYTLGKKGGGDDAGTAVGLLLYGHRPSKLPWGYREEDARCLALKARMMDAVEAAYAEGYRHFLCGMAQGCDLYFCQCALALRQQHPDVTVEAAIPCPTQADAWPR